MDVHQRVEVGELQVAQERRLDEPRVVDHRRDRVVTDDLGCRLARGFKIGQIDMHVLELRMREAGGLHVERDHLMTRVEQSPRDGPADAGTAPGDDGGAQRKS